MAAAIAIALLVLQGLSYISTIAYNGVKIDLALRQPQATTASASYVPVGPATPFMPNEAFVEQESGRVKYEKRGF